MIGEWTTLELVTPPALPEGIGWSGTHGCACGATLPFDSARPYHGCAKCGRIYRVLVKLAISRLASYRDATDGGKS